MGQDALCGMGLVLVSPTGTFLAPANQALPQAAGYPWWHR